MLHHMVPDLTKGIVETVFLEFYHPCHPTWLRVCTNKCEISRKWLGGEHVGPPLLGLSGEDLGKRGCDREGLEVRIAL